VKWNDEALAWLAARTREVILRDDAQTGAADWAVPVLNAEEEGRVIAEWSGGARWTAADYRNALRDAVPAQRPRARLVAAVAAACEAGVTTQLLYEEALRRDLDEEWWAGRALRRAREETWQAAAVAHLRHQESPATAEVDSLTSLLLSVQPQLFRREDRAHVLWLELPTREAADQERDRIQSRGASARLQDILDGEASPLVGTYLRTTLTRGAVELPEIEREVFEGGPGSLAGPHELRGQWVLAACLRVVPGRELSREEALDDVWERTRQAGVGEAPERWVAARKQEIGFSIDEDALDALAPGA
jgi:hypothetical protein